MNFRRALLLVALPVVAHDLYIMPGAFFVPEGRVVIALHDGDAFPTSEVPMRIDRLRDAKLLWQSGAADMKSPRVDGKRVLLDVEVSGSGDMILMGRTTPNFIELDAAKFLAYLKEEGLSEVIEWRKAHGETEKPGRERYSKYFKSIVLRGTPNGYFRQAVGHTIEIIPEKNPYTLKIGESLPVKVILRGQPIAGLQVESAWAEGNRQETAADGKTGSDGRILIPIRKAGKYRLHALIMERCAEPALADWESSWASLTFEVRR